MLSRVIAFSLKNRALVLLAAAALAVYGVYQLAHTPVDVFPDLNRPTVTLLTEAGGLSPEEVELLVTSGLSEGETVAVAGAAALQTAYASIR